MITDPLTLALQHKILGIAVVSCLGAGTGVLAITSASAAANTAPIPLLSTASAATAVPLPPAPPAGVATNAAASPTSKAQAASPAPASAAAVAAPTHAAAAPATAHPAAPATAHPATVAAPAKVKPAATSPATAAGSSAATGSPAAPAAISQPASAPAVSCPSNQRLTDAQITWLLSEVEKTAASNPSVAAGAATIEAELQGLLGQHQCAAQAQPVVTALCSGAATRKTINVMASQMPFLVKLVVGNPCGAKLASLLPKLSSYTSML